MNAKHNHSMSRLVLLTVGVVLSAQVLGAQSLWEEGHNIAGLATKEASGKKAHAALTGRFTSGGFRTLSEGKTLWSVGAEAEAQTQLKDLLLAGNFGFEQQEGTEMMGSMFTHPGYYPIDVLEFTPGRKSRQTYDIAGGLAWKTGTRWIPGFTARFEGTNFAKRKDLRHTTYRQEMELVPSLLFEGNGWRIGASYLFSKDSEFIQAEQIGPAKADSYYAFLDKGMRFGTYQAWDGSGIHLAEPGVDRFPVKKISRGGALQFSLGEDLYVHAELSRAHGEVGEKGYTWFQFPELQWAALAVYRYRENGNSHSFKVDFRWIYTQVYENVVDKITSGGVTTPAILGRNRVFSDKTAEFEATYSLENTKGVLLEASLFIDRNNSLSTPIFPSFDRDSGTHLFFSLGAQVPVGQWELKAGLLTGGGAEVELCEQDNDTEALVTATPFRLQEWWDLEQEVKDALRISASLGARYNFKRIPLYLEAGCEFTHAFYVMLPPGANRQTSYLQLGYNF